MQLFIHPMRRIPMFKKFGMLLLAACFLFSTQAEAGSADQIGVYVTPKFVYGIMGGNKAKAHSYEAGVSETKNLGSLDDVVGGALAIGYDFHKRFNVPIRAELEYSAFGDAKASKSWGTPDDTDRDGIYYQSMKQKIGIQALFANVYYDFRNTTSFTPYVGAGIGMGFLSSKSGWSSPDDQMSLSSSRKHQTNFAWNVGLGCAYEFNDYVALDLGYRYAQFGKAKSGTTVIPADGEFPQVDIYSKTKHVDMHQFMMGVRFTF